MQSFRRIPMMGGSVAYNMALVRQFVSHLGHKFDVYGDGKPMKTPSKDEYLFALVANGEYYGGRIAAPVVGKIMEDTLRYLGVEQQFTEEEKESIDSFVPDVKGLNVENARKRLSAESLKYTVVGNGETVKDQMPKVGANLSANSVVILYTEEMEAAFSMAISALKAQQAAGAMAGGD